MTRLRILLVDDDPSLVDSETANLPSFDNQTSKSDREVYERNFELSWFYDVDQVKRLFNFYDHARVNDPAALLAGVAYPNLIWIDYNFDHTHLIEIAFDRDPNLRRRYEETLDPFRGRDLANWPAPAARADLPEPSAARLPGCTAGISLAMQLRDFACQPVPITAVTDTSETEFYERFLDEQYGRMFALKSDTVLKWYDFFERGLGELRQQIVRAVANGTMTPRIATLDRTVDDDRINLDQVLTFQSIFGVEHFRAEALFFDLIYYHDAQGDCLARASKPADEPAPDEEEPTPAAAIRAWIQDVLSAATGSQAVGELREAIRIADRHRFSLSSVDHGIRLELSGQLADAERRGGDEIETVITSNLGNLDLLGLDAETVRAHLEAGTISKLKIPAHKHRRLRIVQPLKSEDGPPQGHEQDRIVRAAVLALLVFVEHAWVKTQRGDVEALCEDFGELLAADLEMREDLLYELERNDRLPVNPQRLPQIKAALREGRIEPALAQEIGLIHSLANAIAITAHGDIGFDDEDYLSGVGSNRPRTRLHDEVATKSVLAAELLNPAPVHVLMSQHRKSGGDDVRKVLERLELDGEAAPLSVSKILRGDLDAGGLRRGDGRLIKVFAAHYRFPIKDWPNWMRDSARF